MPSPLFSSAKSIAAAIRARDVSAVEVVEAHLERVEQVDGQLNAVVALCGERAMKEAREADDALTRGEEGGALLGVPITVKDSHDTAGVVSTAGTLGRKDHVPTRDATAVARMRAAGAIVLGKTNTPEFTLAFETENLVYGRTNNPYDAERTPGGSSGGAAAIIAAGGSALDLGTDTGGSIRVPAAFCGIAGLKPTSGRVPRTGHAVPWGMGGMDTLTTIGPMARFVEDLALALPIIAGADGVDPAIHDAPLGDPADVDVGALRVAFFTDNGTVGPTAEVDAAIREAARALADAGADVAEDMPAFIAENPGGSILTADGGAAVRRLVDAAGTTETHRWMRRFVEGSEPLSIEEYTALLERMDDYRSRMLAFMRDYDALLSPVRPYAAPPHGESMTPENSAANLYTSAFNTTGSPGAVARVGTSAEGLPIGAQVIARPWREDVALALAAALESALGGYREPEI